MKKLTLLASTAVLFVACATPTPVQKSYLDGANAYLENDYASAEKNLSTCVKEKMLQCNYMMGNIRMKQGKTEEAISYYEVDAKAGHKESQTSLGLAIYKKYLTEVAQTGNSETDLSESIGWLWAAKKNGATNTSDLFQKVTFAYAKENNVDPFTVPMLLDSTLAQYEQNYVK